MGSREYDTYLLAYVPAPLVELTNGGKMVDPEGCIQWLPVHK